MSDERLRELERAARLGDSEAALQLAQLLGRSGQLEIPDHPVYLTNIEIDFYPEGAQFGWPSLEIQPLEKDVVKINIPVVEDENVLFTWSKAPIWNLPGGPIRYLAERIAAGRHLSHDLPLEEIWTPTFYSNKTDSYLPSINDNNYSDRHLYDAIEFADQKINQWVANHSEEMRAAITISNRNEVARAYRAYLRKLNELESYERDIVINVSRWLNS